MSYPKNLLDQLIPYGIFDLDFACIVRTVFLNFDLADLVVCSFELAVAVRYRMAVFNAIFKYADIRIAFLTDAGDNQIALGDETDTGHLVASKLIQSGNAVNYFFHILNR